MTKRRMENYEKDSMLDSVLFRREEKGVEPTQFTAPGSQNKWRARDVIDVHWNLTGIQTPSESYNRIMSCIIGHANPCTGRCQLKQKLIAAETGYSVETVKRAVNWWVSKGFLIKQDMGLGRSNAYHPQWELFQLLWIAIDEDVKAQKEAWASPSPGLGHIPPQVIKGTYAEVIKGTCAEVMHSDLHESQIRISKDESHPEWAHPPSAADATQNSRKEKRGFQEKHSPGSQTTLARQRVQRYIAADPFLSANPPSPEAYAAAVEAEIQKVGSGRSIVSRAANETWKSRRSA